MMGLLGRKEDAWRARLEFGRVAPESRHKDDFAKPETPFNPFAGEVQKMKEPR